jgi:YesN/AraC family two-component response regulator
MLYQQVVSYIDKTKCYTNASLRITDLADGIGVHSSKLSQMFNIYCHQSFADFINKKRIEEFKKRSQDEKFSQYTTVALAEMCGLKKSAFFAAFKKYEGCTPNEWKSQMEQKYNESHDSHNIN